VKRKRWSALSPRSRRLIVAGSVWEAVLKVAALVDLARRPSSEVRGSKLRWVLAVTFINSAGGVPLAYFIHGRRRGRVRP
jgi:hypothetical protein